MARLGILIKFALFSGLRGEEISFAHNTVICENQSGCNCQNLHVIDKNYGYSIVVLNISVGQKHSYFTIVPLNVWNDFRRFEKVNYIQRQMANLLLKNYTNDKVIFINIRKFHYNILCRSGLREQGAEVLAGRAKTVSAKHYFIYELDKMVKQYSEAWVNYL